MINLIISLDLAHLRNETQSDFCPVRDTSEDLLLSLLSRRDNRSVEKTQAKIFFMSRRDNRSVEKY